MAEIQVHFDTEISLEYVDLCGICEIVVKFNGYVHKGDMCCFPVKSSEKSGKWLKFSFILIQEQGLRLIPPRNR